MIYEKDSSKIKCRSLVRGIATGEALVSHQPFGFWGEIDPYTGIVTDIHHEWHGESIAGKILVFPKGRGSTGSGGVFVQAFKCGKAPIALVNLETEFILLAGALSIEVFYGVKISVLDRPEINIFEIIKTGDILKVNGNEGFIEILKKTSKKCRGDFRSGGH